MRKVPRWLSDPERLCLRPLGVSDTARPVRVYSGCVEFQSVEKINQQRHAMRASILGDEDSRPFLFSVPVLRSI